MSQVQVVPSSPAEVGAELYQLVRRLYPICRSITGEGVRRTLEVLREYIPLEVREVPSGTSVFDWTVPKEWNIRDAYIQDVKGRRVVDFRNSNLHVVSYSVPVKKRLSLEELKAHLHTLPDRPDWIPYRTSYYKEDWGFCLTHRQFLALQDPEYEVCIDSSLEDGSLTYGELRIPGQSQDEVLISCHACHPSLCNDNLSGISVATFLARKLALQRTRLSYRFLFIPGTIGSITWLALNPEAVSRIRHGLVLANLGDPGHLVYKKSRRGDAEIDRAAAHVLKHSGDRHEVRDFTPYGYDERQYCSPGINLAVGCLSRTPLGEFPEYHTSADNLQLVQPQFLADSLQKCLQILRVLDRNRVYLNKKPWCEPQLGKRGLYSTTGGASERAVDQLALLWVLNLSDGEWSLLDIAERSGLSFSRLESAARALKEKDLLEEPVLP